mgnify:CR=1 FL=1
MKILKKRDALIEKEKIQRLIILTDKGNKVVKAGITVEEEISQLTPELIKSGKWKQKNLKKLLA